MTSKNNRKRRSKSPVSCLILSLCCFLLIGGTIWLVISLMSNTQKNVVNAMYPLKYTEYVEKAAETYDLDPALIYGVIKTESNFNPEAESHVGAVGLMQIMPESFEWLQTIRDMEGKYSEEDLKKPEINIDFGSYLLRYFYDTYGTKKSAVAAYNAGFVIGQWLEDPQYSEDGKNLDSIPYPETEAYVEKVISAENKYNELYFQQTK